MGKRREVINRKIILLGDPATGKSSILKNMQNGPNYLMEQVMGNKYEIKAKSRSKTYTRITLWDGIVSGYKTDYRPIAYKDTDMIILIYSINSFKTFDNIKTRWLKEVQTYSPDVDLLVIGNKNDTRLNSDDEKMVSYEDGCKLAEDLNAVGFLECSAFDEEGLTKVVETLLKSLTIYQPKNNRCTLM